MKINRLRLLGFKSFVEPTDLIIERGLTGVVGPNGCGKSNLLEALRWVMGETSHKSMRAAAMDDVIFSGTNTRPQRNSAEVTIFLDNSERKAPAEFNEADTIEITRRIEREAGSAYRINGREARQRDVKILFEDAATGARSPALVRQGQISELVNAKPESRRRVLEDAAGIAGLHSRRHEAELRLNQAEGNVARLNDVMGGLTTQIESLKRQARQARRYKELSGEVRRTEALLMHLHWAEAQALVDAEEGALMEALSKLGAATEAEGKSLREEAELAEAIPPLREQEATRGAILARLKSAFDAFEREAERAAERERELRARVEQMKHDIEREHHLAAEARETVHRLDEELVALSTAEAGSDDQAAAAEVASREAESLLQAYEARLTDLTHKAAESRARRASLTSSLNERKEAVAKVERQLQGLAAQTREIAGRAPDVTKLTATTEAGQRLVHEIAQIEVEAVNAEQKVQALANLARAQREASEKARLAVQALDTELSTLTKLLIIPREGDHPPVLDQLNVSPGYEAALASALGDDLDATIVAESPVHWRQIEASLDDGRLPAEAEPLSMHVSAPQELARRLAQIGVIPRELGGRLQMHLKPGQRLVSREGDLWRWDGFVAAADGMTPAAQRLAERNRLAHIYEQSRAEHEAAAMLATAERESAEALAEAEADERSLRQFWREKQAELVATRDALNVIERLARETESKMASVSEARERAEEELVTLHERLAETEEAFAELGANDEIEALLASAQTDTGVRRAAAAEARAAVTGLERERKLRNERLVTCQSEHDRWTARIGSTGKQITGLEARLAELERELQAQAEVPAIIAEKRQKLLDEMSDAERQRQAAADKLAEAENGLRAAAQALRAAQAAVSTEREARARSEAKLENARAKRQEDARRIREMFEVAPDDCLKLAEVKEGEALAPLHEVDRTLTRLKADRERLGGVNLQADEELTTISEQYQSMEKERADVEEAIAKLRAAIQQLNREAKKRLQEAFETVNGHFQRLFTTLFSGGEARLEMIESEEDPLEGGLEIIAKPPGKKPATLSLLSGGEQTLTALSLIFAVFLTNPSPICVLDEVDAPLDDANVDRFCTLMEKMADETATRFLVITHHPMTMARMNRLFGVTMAERGISQLVSVDLETARAFREAV